MNSAIICKDYESIRTDMLHPGELSHAEREKLEKQFSIVIENGQFRATRKVGVTEVEKLNGEKVTLRIEPRFPALDPLLMLEELTRDEDFLAYAESGPEPLYAICTDRPPVKVEGHGTGEALTALAFVMRLYELCRRQLKPRMTQLEENMTGKVKGKILFKQHVRLNVLRGMEHRVYCRYSLNTVDNIENRILKAALRVANRILSDFFRHNRKGAGALASRIAYCRHALRDVSERKIAMRDFAAVRTNGYYAYYKPSMALARLILQRSYVGARNDGQGRMYEVMPYWIDMQQLFEVYIHSKLKELAKTGIVRSDIPYGIRINAYGQAYPLTSNARGHGESEAALEVEGDHPLHIQNNIRPDFYLQITRKPAGENREETRTVVLDAKYKHAHRQNREDTLQIFAYAYLLKTDALGFIFPQEADKDGKPREHVTGTVRKHGARYFELFLNIGDGSAGIVDAEALVGYVIDRVFGLESPEPPKGENSPAIPV